jgi:hypothetical protein
MQRIRLQDREVAAIRAATRAAFGDDAVVRLFGSRCDPARRGGDIDLHFDVRAGAATDQSVERFEQLLFGTLDPQKVDKIFTERGTAPSPFAQIALRDGVVL